MVRFEHPLQWLAQQPRTKFPQRARFGNHSPSKAGDYLIYELEKLGGSGCIISSNLQTRMRGEGFYAKQNVTDSGVVVYFSMNGKQKAMACDKWDRVEHNLWALYLSVQAIRGLERWGGSELLDGLFTGFTALPSPDDVIIVEKQYFPGEYSQSELRQKYKRLAKELHPDNGGDTDEFITMRTQYEQKLRGGSK